MDKLKAIQCFSAAQSGSLSAAARQQGVTLQAVAKLVNALEAELGTTLFQRGSRGLQLTADGAQYAEACAPLLAQLQAADDGLRQARQRPRARWWWAARHSCFSTASCQRCPRSMPAIRI